MKGILRVPKPTGKPKNFVAGPTHPHQPDTLNQIWPAPFNNGSDPLRTRDQNDGRKNDQNGCCGQHRAAEEGEKNKGAGEDEANVC